MWKIVVGLQQKLNKKSRLSLDDEEMAKAGEKRKSSEEESIQSSNNPSDKNILRIDKLPSTTCLRKVLEKRHVNQLLSSFITMLYLSMWQRVKYSLLCLI